MSIIFKIRALLSPANYRALIRYYFGGFSKILFFCELPGHFEYIMTTFEKTKNFSKVSIVFDRKNFMLKEFFPPEVFVIDGFFLRFFFTKLFVTPASHVKRTKMPFFCRARIHMLHSLVSTHMAYHEDAFDGYDAIFCCGEHHLEELTYIFGSMRKDKGEKSLFRTGYGKMDSLIIKQKEIKAKKPKHSKDSKKNILIAPSWGKGNIIDSTGFELVQFLLEKGFSVTLRPHPLFFTKNLPLMNKLSKTFHNDHFLIENPSDPPQSLFTCDHLITDYSGIAFEFAFLRLKPVLFLDVPLKSNNPNWNLLPTPPVELSFRCKIGRIIHPKNIATIPDVLDSFDANEKFFRLNLLSLRDKFIFNFADCGTVASNQLRELL